MGFLTIKKHFLLYYFKLTGVMNVGYRPYIAPQERMRRGGAS
jgi:hypothetical protein